MVNTEWGMEQMQQEGKARTSAMVDGEASPEESSQWLASWGQDADARADWHLYHLIGDVMRSDELATEPVHDERLVQRVRQALATEPVVVSPGTLPPAAPSGVTARRPRLRVWAASAAAAAGFSLVAGAYLVSRVDVDAGMRDGFSLSALSGWTSAAPASRPADELRRASVGLLGQGAPAEGPMAAPWALRTPVGSFREILRLPRGPASQPMQSVEVLYSNGAATISVQIEPYRPHEHVPKAETGERLNALSVQRDGVWLTLMGDVPLSTLSQFAASMQPVN